jgi:hypothetical protein
MSSPFSPALRIRFGHLLLEKEITTMSDETPRWSAFPFKPSAPTNTSLKDVGEY